MKKSDILRVVSVIIVLIMMITPMMQMLNVNANPEIQGEDELIEAVKVNDTEIEKSSLIIGSYIIHLNGLTDDVFYMAKESANEFSQANMYYKSELADGKWFDVTSASSLEDIISEGMPIEREEIEQLNFTHKVSSTGEVTDLRYGYRISAFDVKAPYSLWDLEELKALKTQYELISEKKIKTDSDKKNMEMIQSFYEKSIRTSKTDQYDDIITGLERYKNVLPGRGKTATWIEEVQKVMKHTDALRRVEAFQILAANLEILLNDISGQENSSVEEEGETEEEMTEEEMIDFYVNADLVEAVGDAIDNVEQSILEKSTQILTEGNTSDSLARYQYSNDLMNGITKSTQGREYDNLPWYYRWYLLWIKVRSTSAIEYNVTICDTATQKLVDITNISSGVIVDINSERTTAEEISIAAYETYKEKLSAGIGEAYKDAVVENKSQAAKEQCLSEQKRDTNVARQEYQGVLFSYFERLSNKSMQQYVEKLLNEISDLEALVPEDAVKSYQLETVTEHREWLRDMLAQAMLNSSDSSEMDKLTEAMSDLEKQRQEALDNNNLKGEKKIAADMEALQGEIDKLVESLVNELDSPYSTEAEKARALAGLGDGNATALLNSLSSDIASRIRNINGTGTTSSGVAYSQKEAEELKNKMEIFSSISAFAPDAAAQALKDIEEAVAGASLQNNEFVEDIQATIGVVKEKIEDGQKGNLTNIDSEELISMLENILGCTLEEATAIDFSGAVLALSRFGYEHNNREARSLAITYAAEMYDLSHVYIYSKVETEKKEYVSVRAIGQVLDYRYVFDDAHYSATLSKGKSYHTFTKDLKDYSYTGKKTGKLTTNVVFQDTLYLGNADAKKIYNIEAGYVHGSKYAIVVTEQVEKRTKEFYDWMVEQSH